MPTLEVVCVQCHQKKWPTLPDRPDHYVCVLCQMVTPAQRAKRLATGQKAARNRRTRRGTS